MRNKKAKEIRKSLRESADKIIGELVANIVNMPFKSRARLAWMILKGVRKKNRKDGNR